MHSNYKILTCDKSSYNPILFSWILDFLEKKNNPDQHYCNNLDPVNIVKLTWQIYSKRHLSYSCHFFQEENKFM